MSIHEVFLQLQEVPDEDTDVRVRVTFEYSPAEPRVMYERDGSGYPGSPAYVSVLSVDLQEINGEPVRSFGLREEKIQRQVHAYVEAEIEEEGSYVQEECARVVPADDNY